MIAKKDYLESVSMFNDPVDEHYLSTPPDDKKYFYDHENCIRQIDQLLAYFSSHRFEIRRTYKENKIMFPSVSGHDLEKPSKLRQVKKELRKFRKNIRQAKKKNAGFWLDCWLDY